MPGKRHLIFPKYSQTVGTQILYCCPTQRLNSGINSTHDLLNQLSSNFQAMQWAPLTCPDKFLDLAQSEIFHLAFQLKHFLVKWILHCVFVWLNHLSSNFQAEQWAPLTCPDKFHDFWTWHRVRFFNWPSNWNTFLWGEYCTVFVWLSQSTTITQARS